MATTALKEVAMTTTVKATAVAMAGGKCDDCGSFVKRIVVNEKYNSLFSLFKVIPIG